MLLVTNISAIEYKTFTENVTDYNENELINAIKDRIELLKIQNPNPKLTLNGDDPDGPFKGGLDDFYDWNDCFFGIMCAFILSVLLKNHVLMEAISSGKIYAIITNIIKYGLYTWATLISFGDAFDIIDPDEDGY